MTTNPPGGVDDTMFNLDATNADIENPRQNLKVTAPTFLPEADEAQKASVTRKFNSVLISINDLNYEVEKYSPILGANEPRPDLRPKIEALEKRIQGYLRAITDLQLDYEDAGGTTKFVEADTSKPVLHQALVGCLLYTSPSPRDRG